VSRLLPILTLVALLVMAGPVAAKNANPGVIPPNAKPFGKTYEQWSVTWWNWAISLPVTNHPLFDQTGENCGVGQQGQVWFLGGVFGFSGDAERTCTLPTGKAIFFPILNIFGDNIDPIDPNGPPTELTEQGLIDTYCEPFLHDNVALNAEVDGRALKNLEEYEIEPTLFQYDMPEEDSLYDFFGVDWAGAPPPPGAVSCGYYLMLAPLPKGEHTLHFHASTDGLGGFELDVTYNLEVVPAGQLKAAGAAGTASVDDGGASGTDRHHNAKKSGQHRGKGKHRR
jgi:hypothetical protein